MHRNEAGKSIVAFAVVCMLMAAGLMVFPKAAKAEEVVLKAAVQDEMKTKNILGSSDVWTSHVLWNCYESILQGDPNTLKPVPYILIGYELNGVAGLQSDETYDHFKTLGQDWWGFLPASLHDSEPTQATANKHDIIAYYNFEGAFFHDGQQADIKDVIFSYHLAAQHPNWYSDIAPFMDDGGLSGNYSSTRWLYIMDVSSTYSDDGNSLTSALRFHLTMNYANVWLSTLAMSLFPQHIWEGTGGGFHEDFGYAIDANGVGVPSTSTDPKPFDLIKAQGWTPTDSQVIGTGMFKFSEWVVGSYAKIVKNANYLEKTVGTVNIHRPYIDAVQFVKYSTTQLATLALKTGEVDIILWSVPPDFISDLQTDPNIAIVSNPEPGFFYQAFNMRSQVFGYPNGDPANGDTGKPLRKAIAHLIDKTTIVDYYLQGYGIIADGPVSPLNTLWYNSTLPQYLFSIDTAKSILNANGYIDNNGDGWRDLDPLSAGDQDAEIELLAPTPDYDPIRAQACILIEQAAVSAGIHLKCKHLAFGTIVSRIDTRDFQMFILGWAIGGTDPDYLYSFFYSLNADKGQNYPGYKSSQFDSLILASRSETDSAKRQSLIRDAQGVLAEDLPYNVLYYRKNIEAYRLDRFTGWTMTSRGSLFNYWSLMNLKQPSANFLRTTVSLASAISAGKTETVTVTVRDQDRAIVPGATVNLTIEQGNISCAAGVYNEVSCEGVSNANGQFLAQYIAPTDVDNENGSKVSVNVKAVKTGYDDSGITSAFTTIFPSSVDFLSVTMKLPYGDVIDEEGETPLEVEVKDKNQQPVDGAFVELTVAPTGLTISPKNGTTSGGGTLSSVTVTAPEVDFDTPYTMTGSPSKSGYKGVNGTVQLSVLDVTIPPPPPTPGFEVFLVIAAAAMAMVVYGIFRARKKET